MLQQVTPYFLKISEEFLRYLAGRADEFIDLPYIAELAHYEWLELAVDVMDADVGVVGVDSDADVMTSVPVFPAALASAAYQYPVHLASKSNSTLEPQPTGLILFRDENDKVRFIHCNVFTLRLFEVLREGEFTAGAALEAILQEAGMEPSAAALAGGEAILKDWRQQGLILGGQLSL